VPTILSNLPPQSAKAKSHPIPRLPVLDWQTFTGPKSSSLPCLLNLPAAEFTNSGRASILIALEMLGIGKGDQVLVPTYHCPTMITPIIKVGAEPFFYPLNDDGSADLRWIETQDISRVRVLLAAHFFGLPQAMAVLRTWCDSKKIRLIEDCAHALFGISDGRPVGNWGDLAIASLTKFLPVPEGGCLINNSGLPKFPLLSKPTAKEQVKAAFDIVHAGVNHGRLKGIRSTLEFMLSLLKFGRKQAPLIQADDGVSSSNSLEFDLGPTHQRLTGACRCLALQAPRQRIVEGRRQQYLFFTQAFQNCEFARPLVAELPADAAPYVFPLWVADPDPGYFELRRLGFPVSRWDRLWPDVSRIPGDVGQEWSHHILQLACHQDLSPDEMRRMVALIKSVYSPTTRTNKGEV